MRLLCCGRSSTPRPASAWPVSIFSVSSLALSSSNVLTSFSSHCASTSTMVSSVRGMWGLSTLMPSSLSPRCSIPAFIAISVFATFSYLTRCLSQVAAVSPSLPSYSSTMRRDPSRPEPAYLSSSSRASIAVRSAFSWSIRTWLSLVICLRLLCVSSCVMNFWITSLTSDTPVASLIFLNASSKVVMRVCSSSSCALFLTACVSFMRCASSMATRSPAASSALCRIAWLRASARLFSSCRIFS
mmetsp:Transcript_10765/g.22418  ORF Transcript_10765/g.22418 Transcript_10765/m.22418 type:complete len:243 (+) Transcript_10765:594-1322(+)